VVAALLPMSILWVFAACVSICGRESAAAQGQNVFTATVEVNEVNDVSECEGCPDASLLKATATERTTFKPDQHVLSGVPASIFTVASKADARAFTPTYRQQFPTYPPLTLLRTLRI
jgi:hypothetical protein